ncbi:MULTISPECIES: hypothetical protein [unclassified Streptomyces]|uniref:hypothetical protein n=1 Tax=unclassified Streptomyces TaxID=2593676 RepID=UPI000823C57A|nr:MULTISPECIES: hypothetical protein [unclassified Streptomyces]MYU02090.1 hypothetical protein [Streptomyces sp. SID8350]SCK61514.1 hypothetical protein YUWDRAFT_06152 [Streptomyces sp. AmelKG-D3]
MRRHTTTALVLTTLAAFALAGCSGDNSSSSDASPKADSTPRGGDAAAATPLSSAALNKRLLTEKDLGEGYVRKAEPAQRHDDVTVIGCPALDKLGGDAATGGSLNFPRKAKTTFAYSGSSNSEVSEELYSDTTQKLSDGVDLIFDAMASCPKYQVVAGNTAIDMSTQTTAAPDLGEEQWSQLLTYSADGQHTVVKQTAIRTGNIVLIVSGSPALVDAHVDAALSKALSHG